MYQAREELEREVLAQYRAMMHRFKASSGGAWMEIDLTLPQLRTLLILAEEGTLVIGQIAQRLGIGLSTGGHLVDRLGVHLDPPEGVMDQFLAGFFFPYHVAFRR